MLLTLSVLLSVNSFQALPSVAYNVLNIPQISLQLEYDLNL